MKDIAESKIRGYLHGLEMLDKLDDKYDANCSLIEANINKLNEKIDKYLEFENTMDETGENEINLADSGARTVKLGAHQGIDVEYNVQAVIDKKIS
ncbi:hypothetical protein [Terrisporobacter vanillatitrophus]|uniref:hypothetical protein n=1 Tax=Terrisporobacter vanillatitrophus TaxID=3058402 RepID=UPI003367037F